MRVIHPELLVDLGDQIPAVELTLGIRRAVDDHPGRLEQMSAVIDLSEFEYVSWAELMEESMELVTVSPGWKVG